MSKKTAIIIGAGPAGLTAAYELLDKTDIRPVVFEMTGDIGGISKTINFKGNRLDIGGHRFFSKSNHVMQWWQNILPLQGAPSKDDIFLERNVPCSQKKGAPDPEKTDNVMLVRQRLSKIFFMRKFFDYPISLSMKTLLNLGPTRAIKIFMSYIKIRLFPIKVEKNLEDFFINRFGRELYLTFFKDYTKKVWGISCDKIKPEWGAQRIKGLDINKAILHAIKSTLSRDPYIDQRNVETSLIGQFMYPKLGPGQFWEEVARIVKERGGEIYLGHKAISLKQQDNRIVAVEIKKELTGGIKSVEGDYFFSTMPVKELIQDMGADVPEEVKQVAQGLMYRDFITVGLLVKKLKIKNETKIMTINNIIPENWLYIQEQDVKMGRIQIFNNWSPYMVKDQNTVWIGLEYFCSEGDALWNKSDDDLVELAKDELVKIGFIEKGDILDSKVVKMQKTYPAYFGNYDQFHVIKEFVNNFENLFLIGRNGMHRYNNQDHSMLTAMVAVENIINNIITKDNIWAINIAEAYYEKDRSYR